MPDLGGMANVVVPQCSHRWTGGGQCHILTSWLATSITLMPDNGGERHPQAHRHTAALLAGALAPQGQDRGGHQTSAGPVAQSTLSQPVGPDAEAGRTHRLPGVPPVQVLDGLQRSCKVAELPEIHPAQVLHVVLQLCQALQQP